MKGFIKDIRKAIGGNEMDFTKGNIYRAIILLSIPMILEMVWESVFAIVDIYFVSKLGAGPVAIVGITESVLTLVYAIGIGFSMAVTALVSRRIGEKNPDKAAIAAAQAITMAIIMSLIFTIPGIFFPHKILELMGADPEIISEGQSFTSIMLAGNSIIMLLFINNAVFRSAGDAAISMKVLLIANLINIILDPCLIFGWGPFPELGLKGAAIATTIGRGIAVIIQFVLLFKGSKRIHVKLNHFALRLKIMFKLFKLSIGGISQFLIATSSWIIIMRMMAEFGSEVLAGYTIGIRIIIFTILPSWGMSNAAATLVGQNLGAKQPYRAEKSTWITAYMNAAFLFVVSILFFTIPHVFVSYFEGTEAVHQAAVKTIQIVCFGYLFYGFGMVMSQAFNGAGDTFTPTIINIICFWLIEIPLAYLLGLYTSLNETGILIAITISESLTGILGVIIFKRGKWKYRKV